MAAAPDAALLNRVQQENQRQILGKLLHDLRNPVHSLRISMELFGRIARRTGDFDKMMERAAAYITPAEAALHTLVTQTERVSRYLMIPGAVEISPTALHELLSEIAILLRGSKRRLNVSIPPPDGDSTLKIYADRSRLGQVLLHCCLNNEGDTVGFAASRWTPESISIDITLQADPGGGERSLTHPLTVPELTTLIETAGGTVAAVGERDLSLHFKCWREPPPPG
jgi:hypothetical protein